MHNEIINNETEAKRYQCRHIFTDGRRCGSPCLRGEPFCYYHHTTRKPVANPHQRRARHAAFTLPLPEDHSAIQAAIGILLQRLAANHIDLRRARLLLYALRIASANLPKAQPQQRPDPQPDHVEQVVTHPDLGPLAPPSEFDAPQQRRSLAGVLLAELRKKPVPCNCKPQPAPAILPTLNAEAEPESPTPSPIQVQT